ncbi:MAG: 5'/3'-nucleotidase SurE [Xanthomonadales bacterium]|nr:5'/3'-nucleotidase SurE [Xanthomonadales bacterium]
MDSAAPLHILLTNDDGHAAPGIRTLQRVLREAGYNISTVAPSDERSATGMGVTSRRNLSLQQTEETSWHLDGQPADTVLVALRHILHNDPPDLVISGINFGPNLGTDLHISGTFGAAAIAAILGVPSIAVSAGLIPAEANHAPRRFPSTHDVLEPAAVFTRSVVESLLESKEPGGRLLPMSVLLNINYPALPRDKIRGVLHPEISGGHIVELVYRHCTETGQLVPGYKLGVNPDQPRDSDGDVRAHLEGYITVSAVKPSWNPPAEEAQELHQRLKGLNINA